MKLCLRYMIQCCMQLQYAAYNVYLPVTCKNIYIYEKGCCWNQGIPWHYVCHYE